MQYCLQPKCGELVARGYCRRHRGDRGAGQGSAASRGYGYRWKMRAKAFLRRHRLCGMRPDGQAPVLSRCHDAGRTTLAECVDHVKPHRDNATLFWDEQGNWQALCFACHARKTDAGQ